MTAVCRQGCPVRICFISHFHSYTVVPCGVTWPQKAQKEAGECILSWMSMGPADTQGLLSLEGRKGRWLLGKWFPVFHTHDDDSELAAKTKLSHL